MMRSSNKQEAIAQQPVFTEGLYQGEFIIKLTDPFFGYELATSTARLEISLVKKSDVQNQFQAHIIVTDCHYDPLYLKGRFPNMNIDTTVDFAADESSQQVMAKEIFQFISSDEDPGALKVTREADGSISTQGRLLIVFSMFAKVKKQAVAANEPEQDLPCDALFKSV